MLLEVDVFTWLPYARVDNLLWGLPDRAPYGAAASGPWLEGDNYTIPPAYPEEMKSRSARTWQRLELALRHWGDESPGKCLGPLVAPVHVLGENGERVHSAQGQVFRSTARAGFHPKLDAYELVLAGETSVPILAEAAAAHDADGSPMSSPPLPIASWQLTLFWRKGSSAAHDLVPTDFDDSLRCFGPRRSLGGTGENALYGAIRLRRFLSCVVYVSLSRSPGGRSSAPVFFFNGVGRSITGILSQESSRIRPVSW